MFKRMTFGALRALCLSLAVVLPLSGCETTREYVEPAVAPMTMSDVITLSNNATPPTTIASLARNTGLAFALDSNNVIALHQAGVGDETLNMLLAVEEELRYPAVYVEESAPAPEVSIGLGFGFGSWGGHGYGHHYGGGYGNYYGGYHGGHYRRGYGRHRW